MLIGYARVSTHDQTLHLQQDALEKADCRKIFTDVISGAKVERKGLAEALEYVRAGDTLVVWRLDRLGRSLKDLIEKLTELHNRQIGFTGPNDETLNDRKSRNARRTSYPWVTDLRSLCTGQ